jgi:hypothetical protein
MFAEFAQQVAPIGYRTFALAAVWFGILLSARAHLGTGRAFSRYLSCAETCGKAIEDGLTVATSHRLATQPFAERDSRSEQYGCLRKWNDSPIAPPIGKMTIAAL